MLCHAHNSSIRKSSRGTAFFDAYVSTFPVTISTTERVTSICLLAKSMSDHLRPISCPGADRSRNQQGHGSLPLLQGSKELLKLPDFEDGRSSSPRGPVTLPSPSTATSIPPTRLWSGSRPSAALSPAPPCSSASPSGRSRCSSPGLLVAIAVKLSSPRERDRRSTHGLCGGLAGGLLGVGGGILFVPALAIFMDETQVRAEATSLLAIVPVALVAVWRQLGYGNVRVREGLVIGALSPMGA